MGNDERPRHEAPPFEVSCTDPSHPTSPRFRHTRFRDEHATFPRRGPNPPRSGLRGDYRVFGAGWFGQKSRSRVRGSDRRAARAHGVSLGKRYLAQLPAPHALEPTHAPGGRDDPADDEPPLVPLTFTLCQLVVWRVDSRGGGRRQGEGPELLHGAAGVEKRADTEPPEIKPAKAYLGK